MAFSSALTSAVIFRNSTCFPRQQQWPILAQGSWRKDVLNIQNKCREEDAEKFDEINRGHGIDEGLTYKPSHCQLVPFLNGLFVSALVRLNSSLILVGDSMVLGHMRHLQCHLHIAPSKCADPLNQSQAAAQHVVCTLSNTAIRLVYVRMNRIPNHTTMSNVFMQYNVGPKDIAMFGWGPHYNFRYLQNFFKDLELLLAGSTSFWPQILWRQPLPQHFADSRDGFYTPKSTNTSTPCGKITDPRRNAQNMKAFESSLRQLLFPKSPLILQVNAPLIERFAEHTGLMRDCCHFLHESSAERFIATALFNAILSRI
mmetsp:Transcript_57477/g.95061  ORF Transcript_57477/g.95061 Transcript_57477/m.95061 type:complete len:314 (+) Transcript_57477:68-1009(+)|eukprot:CAMPEP_0119331026 /NCGR_PEP_ID=MMETSP1333-20130426/79578_1 /TAXON_ID=418940 /ORGANISM="Scyphosphaera apsteinii, Strain RCC1455" /LENGTH=313 /DNA_ID=CAMNT_0007340535 /DNA_START=55 /DNA_END=996 /DNA_ORIENTATION=-